MSNHKKHLKSVIDYLQAFKDFEHSRSLLETKSHHLESIVISIKNFVFFVLVSKIQDEGKHYVHIETNLPLLCFSEDKDVYLNSFENLEGFSLEEYMLEFREKNRVKLWTLDRDLYRRYSEIISFKKDDDCLKLWCELLCYSKHKRLLVSSDRSRRFLVSLITYLSIRNKDKFFHLEYAKVLKCIRKIRSFASYVRG